MLTKSPHGSAAPIAGAQAHSLPATQGLRAGASAGGARLRLLSYNVQTGISTRKYRHYVTHSWKHVLPHPQRLENIHQIGQLLRDYDVVGLQEVDAGSMRSEFVNLTEYLARVGHFPCWCDLTNRRLGRIAQHAMGFLTRVRPDAMSEHRLPGAIPGRAALVARYGEGEEALMIVVVHLALGRRARQRQYDHVRRLIYAHPNVIVMGDFNAQSEGDDFLRFLHRSGLREPVHGLHTYPSWRPQRNIDHILVSPTIKVEDLQVLDYPYSDHLPIAMEVRLPRSAAAALSRCQDQSSLGARL
jgi:endonuclease/exonuclease/phosphatase family metal-dependent hydrolase